MSEKRNRKYSKSLTEGTHSGLSKLSDDSSPSFGTEKSGLARDFSGFFVDQQNEWQYSVAAKEKYPYKLAKIVHHNYDLSKRWYVIFYAWNVATQKLQRKRLFDEINKRSTVRQRLEVAEYVQRVVNGQLRDGKVLGKDEAEAMKINILKMTVVEAIDFVRTEKSATEHRVNYHRCFKSIISNWKNYLEHIGQDDFAMRLLTRDHVMNFFRYLKKEKGIANKTHNNYKNYLRTVINYLMKREQRLFKINPVAVVDALPVIARKHAAFSDKEMNVITKKCDELGFHQQLLFIRFLYYTLARPNELIQLRIRNIDLDNDRLMIPGEASKTRFDEYVGISTHFKKIILDSGIMSFSGDFFLFTKEGVPGPVRYATPQALWRKNQEVLKATGLYEINPNYSLYSYKHSGAISLYTATKDIKLVQRQCRHKTLNQTNEYLRDLGLVSGLEGLQEWKGAV